MRQVRDMFGQNLAVALDILTAHFQQVIKRPRDHMALFDLRSGAHRVVEGPERVFAGVRQPHLDEHNMRRPQPPVIDQRLIAGDIARPLKPFEARLRGGFGQADAAGQIGHADAPVTA